jgi:glycosyltransferase involved in cell wall biosynthesis
MNILMLGPWLPSTRRSVVTERLHRFARHLAHEHRLTLAFTTDHPNPVGAISALREEFEDLEFSVVPSGWKRLWSAARMATGSSAEVTYFSSTALTARIRDRLRSSAFDLVYVASSSMIPYVLNLERPLPVVLDFGELDSEWWREQSRQRSGFSARIYQAEAERLRDVEITGARHATLCLAATPRAAALVKSFGARVAVSVIPNGVDTDESAPPPFPSAPNRIVFNPCLERDREVLAAAEFCSQVLSPVRTRVESTTLLIGCKRLFSLAKRLAHLPGVEVAAPASDLRPLLRRASVAVAPGRFGGETQRGVLEAMAAGVPVVTSREVLNGLPVQHERELYVEADPAGFTERLIDLLHKPTLREVMGARGRAFVRAHCSWAAATARLSQILEAAASGATRNGSAPGGKGAGTGV